MTQPLTVFLADDQSLVRSGFRRLIDAEDDMTVVGEATNGLGALTALTANPADVVLMDIRMPEMDGVEATRRIVASGAAAKVLVLTTFDLDEYVYSALQAGASGFLLKDAGPAELLAGIRAVHSGEAVVAPSATRRLLERFVPMMPGDASTGKSPEERLGVLTEREREVLTLVGTGLTNSEIAQTLFLAEATVKTHIGHILAKLALRDRVGMVVFAYDTGLVRPQP